MRALILCAGLGTRLGLKRTPKVMVKVNKKPILEHLVNHLNKYGITEIIINIHKNYESIFKYFGTRLLYLYEPVLLGERGTEDILSNWLGVEYIVMNGDTMTNLDIKKLISNQYTISFVSIINKRYAGTIYVNKKTPLGYDGEWDGDGAYYYDCGTPAKLAKARRMLK